MEMEKIKCSSAPTQIGEEEFIELEVNPKVFAAASSTKGSPPHSREFEFQMSSSHHQHTTQLAAEAATSPSPADELFYKGNLLPLHLPPRLQMVQKLLLQQTSLEEKEEGEAVHIQSMKAAAAAALIMPKSFTAPSTISNTPLESCNISPTESCRVSCELNPDEHFFSWSTESTAFIGCDNNGGCGKSGGYNGQQHARNSWSRRLRMMKQQPSSLTQKLRAASRAYLKSLFLTTNKSDCPPSNTNDDPDEEDNRREAWNMLKAREYVNKYIKIMKKMNYPFGHTENLKPQGHHHHPHEKQAMSSSFTMKSILDREITDDENQTTFTCHRRSFSGAIKRHCTSKCYSSVSSSSSSSSSSQSSSSNSSSSSSSNSSFSLPKSANGFYEINLLKRSTSANSELENSVEGAIAHCKKSQQMKMQECLRGNGSDQQQQQLGSCLLSASRRAGGCNKRTELGRI